MVGMQTMSGAVFSIKRESSLCQSSDYVQESIYGYSGRYHIYRSPFRVHLLLSVSCRHCRSLVRLLLQQLFRSPWESVSVQPVLFCSLPSERTRMEKRTALIYLLNDLFGMIFWSIVFYSINAVVHFTFMDEVMTPFRTALLNSVFRILTILVLDLSSAKLRSSSLF